MNIKDTDLSRNLFTVATYYVPTDAHIVTGCLVAAGIPAVVADDNLVQTDSLLTPALGGVRILAPETYLERAKEVIDAFNRGDYALDENADVGAVDADPDAREGR